MRFHLAPAARALLTTPGATKFYCTRTGLSRQVTEIDVADGGMCEYFPQETILFDGAQAPHYNYIGDSVMGHKAHTGAGAVTSNLKQDHSNVTVLKDGERVETGMRKFGAMLGDHAEIGCGSVLNPGTVVGKNARVYPLSMVRGFVPANHIYKKAGEVAEIHD